MAKVSIRTNPVHSHWLMECLMAIKWLVVIFLMGMLGMEVSMAWVVVTVKGTSIMGSIIWSKVSPIVMSFRVKLLVNTMVHGVDVVVVIMRFFEVLNVMLVLMHVMMLVLMLIMMFIMDWIGMLIVTVF